MRPAFTSPTCDRGCLLSSPVPNKVEGLRRSGGGSHGADRRWLRNGWSCVCRCEVAAVWLRRRTCVLGSCCWRLGGRGCSRYRGRRTLCLSPSAPRPASCGCQLSFRCRQRPGCSLCSCGSDLRVHPCRLLPHPCCHRQALALAWRCCCAQQSGPWRRGSAACLWCGRLGRLLGCRLRHIPLPLSVCGRLGSSLAASLAMLSCTCWHDRGTINQVGVHQSRPRRGVVGPRHASQVQPLDASLRRWRRRRVQRMEWGACRGCCCYTRACK
jgi:hypothetical protein